jgi:DNA polymerase III subunit epsilon
VKSCSIRKQRVSIPQTDIGSWRLAPSRSCTRVSRERSFTSLSIQSATSPGHNFAVLKDKPVFASVVEDFLAFIGDSKLVIHNAEFDMRFVNAELARLGLAAIGMDRVVDTLALARKRHPGAPASLDALCDRYRIDRSRRVRHGALLDAEILVEVYCELTGGRQRSLVFGEGLGDAEARVVAAIPRSGPRPVRASPVERSETNAHLRYIESLGPDAIWFRYLAQPAPA